METGRNVTAGDRPILRDGFYAAGVNSQAGGGFDGVASVGDTTQTDNGDQNADCDANSQSGQRI
jgi:hypothetical protein